MPFVITPPSDDTSQPVGETPPVPRQRHQAQTPSEAATRHPAGDISTLVRDDKLPQPSSPYTGLQAAPDADQWLFKETGEVRNAQTQFVQADPQTGEKKVYQRTPQLTPGQPLITPPPPKISPAQRLAESWRDEPGYYYSPLLPFRTPSTGEPLTPGGVLGSVLPGGVSRFLGLPTDSGPTAQPTGAPELAWPEWIRSMVRGTAELLGGAGGELPYGTDLSDDAKLAIYQTMTSGPRAPLRKLSPETPATPPAGTKPGFQTVPRRPGILTKEGWQREGAPRTWQSVGPAGVEPSWERAARPAPRLSVGGAAAKAAAPLRKALGFMWDIDKEALTRSVELANQGYRVAPSAYAPGFARGQRWVDLAISLKADPLKAGAERLAEEGVQRTLERAQFLPNQIEELRQSAAALQSPSLEPAGAAIKSAAEGELRTASAGLRAATNQIRADVRMRGAINVAEHQNNVRKLQRELTNHQTAMQRAIDADWNRVNQMRQIDPVDLAPNMAQAVRDIRQRVSTAAEADYDAADVAAGDALINVRNSDVAVAAHEFLEQAPQELQQNMPGMIRAINRFIGPEGEGRRRGDLYIPPGRMTFGELRYLRTQLRDAGDNEKLTPSFKRGPYQHIAHVVDELIHNNENHPQIQAGAQLLDQADVNYAREMARFRDNTIQGLVDNMRAGLPPDPESVSRQIIQGSAGNAARLREILGIAGPEITEQIRSADLRDMIEHSRRELSDDLDPKRLLIEVDHRFKNGSLQQLYGPQGARDIVRLTQRLAARAGEFPTEALEQGDFRTWLQHANVLSDELQRLAKVDPVKMMNAAVTEGRARVTEAVSQFRTGRQSDILARYSNPQLMAATAAEELLDTKNIPRLREAIARWGNDSEPVRRLRLVALERIIKPLVQKESPFKVLETLEGMPREQQQLLFPGEMADDIKRVAENLRMIYGKTVPGMPGFAVGEILDMPTKRYLQKLIQYDTLAFLVTSPQFIRMAGAFFRAGGRSAIEGRQLLRDRFVRWLGASYLTGNAPEQQEGSSSLDYVAPTRPGWRERATQRTTTQPRSGGWQSRVNSTRPNVPQQPPPQ